ncbi:tetratricopeptide repeat protein [Flavobacterium gawalongense]|uniref:Tetratricopeptide repeat protein n=1 Tax=Flavobacterium gawalongense TaxID=2594432 RepID=A0A553BQU9_9FLAO|nr:tetratricopeptide repeat protein [Flavobacterium gawalongense]TRX10634.1 tetratricopeptide repeat protein [Flavobacterium gawalongense]TRX11783.1 tetratricopeptide repeat protein [Flavobacterium gawalongense]TRX29575.1 tetratricopeptide repeat protein [Flavobacterium gawalongense]
MRKISWGYFFFFFIITATISAQKSTIYTHDSKDFNKAVSLFKDAQYASAQIIFNKVKETATTEELKSDCAYYAANCAIRTNQSNADELMERFVSDYPTSVKQNQAYIEVAHYHFNQGNYPQALQWFDKVDESSLSRNDQNKFNFQKGYSFFNAKKKKEAAVYLNKVVNSAEYGSQAKYYLGFMAYEGDDYKRATKYFDEVSGEEKYKEKLSYYQADMNFKLGNFQKAIDLGEKAMAKSTVLEKSELNKIIGESYFNLNKYDKAIPYLVAYKGKKGRWNNTDFYQLGYAYYKQKDYENAISQFNKIIGGKDFVAQNAYYHLGESYLNTDKKQQALNAFKNASEMEFDAAIQEDASLNYAKLSYELGNSYQSVPAVLQAFLKKYPDNANRSEIERLLIDSYISSKNYKEAFALLEKNKTPENKLAYQKVTFYRGLELYTDGNYPEALKMFTKSINEQKDAVFTARATFWKGETEYVLNDFKDALLSFKQFAGLAQGSTTPEYKNHNYNIAYAYFKLKEYDQAGNYFQSQIEKVKDNKARLNDSYLRLADCRFVTSKYGPAMDAYTKVIESKSVDADYAYFQKAISYGFISKNDKKIDELNAFLQLYPKSAYRDDALFELGNTYVAENKNDLAIKTYDRLNLEFKKSSFTSKSILRQGLIYYNSDKDDQALLKFKKVAADFPRTPEALEAVATARLIYVDNGRVDEYANWVRTLDFVAVTDAELDNDTYEAAEKQFQQNNTKQAIAGFSGYISSFPRGIHALHANFYLAQSYFSEGSESKSIPNYEYVVAQPRSEFTEQSLSRLAQIFLKNKDYNKAIPVLSRLEDEADISQNKTFAQSNLMKLYYDKKDYPNSVIYAEKVLMNPKTDDNVKSDAQIIIARAAMQTGDENKARVAYAKVMTIAKGELAAEALYYDAYFKNKDEKFEASNTAVQKLAKNYSSYKYFGAKGLILMAKNFYGLKDSYQATYILENVIQNFTDFPDVISEAQTELDAIKSEESKTNSSITK